MIAGYMLVSLTSDYRDVSSLLVIGGILGLLVFPLLIKWHYPILIFSWSFPISFFFLPGRPNLFLPMVLVSLTISVVERILNKNQRFVPAGSVRWSLFALLVVVLITAKLTGGFGFRSLGASVYGGKKYATLIVGILSFFAIASRPIPKEKANFYIFLFFAGAMFSILQDLYYYTPDALRFIYYVFPPSSTGMDEFGNEEVILGVTRLGGVAGAAVAFVCWLLARHGIRENLLTDKLWRPLLLGGALLLIPLGGFRSSILGMLLILAIIFYLEKLHRTGLVLVVGLMIVMGGTLLVPLASHLPQTFQRALAFLPLDISGEARANADASTDWRLEMWKALMPEVPKYVALGKGYAFSAATFDESMGPNAMFHMTIDASQDPLALASDFHSGPLSIILPFGIWGVLAWLWYWWAGFYVVWRNYRYGDPDLRHINMYLFAAFVARCFGFLFIFGDLPMDVAGFAALVGLSVAVNHGIKAPQPRAAYRPANLPAKPDRTSLAPARPAFQR